MTEDNNHDNNDDDSINDDDYDDIKHLMITIIRNIIIR